MKHLRLINLFKLSLLSILNNKEHLTYVFEDATNIKFINKKKYIIIYYKSKYCNSRTSRLFKKTKPIKYYINEINLKSFFFRNFIKLLDDMERDFLNYNIKVNKQEQQRKKNKI